MKLFSAYHYFTFIMAFILGFVFWMIVDPYDSSLNKQASLPSLQFGCGNSGWGSSDGINWKLIINGRAVTEDEQVRFCQLCEENKK